MRNGCLYGAVYISTEPVCVFVATNSSATVSLSLSLSCACSHLFIGFFKKSHLGFHIQLTDATIDETIEHRPRFPPPLHFGIPAPLESTSNQYVNEDCAVLGNGCASSEFIILFEPPDCQNAWQVVFRIIIPNLATNYRHSIAQFTPIRPPSSQFPPLSPSIALYRNQFHFNAINSKRIPIPPLFHIRSTCKSIQSILIELLLSIGIESDSFESIPPSERDEIHSNFNLIGANRWEKLCHN